MEPYEKIKCSRSTSRATAKDYIEKMFDNFTELHGDRSFGDDAAIIGGIGWLGDKAVTVIGIEKGKTLEEKTMRGFGSPLPEGYRKAQRLMKQAEKFNRPVVCIVDTQGAGCGAGAEQRGAGQAIADNLYELMTLKTPIITIMAGEGGSGGALALAVADEVWMMENAYYSVITPEACASILYKDSTKAPEAAEKLHLFADNLLEYGIIERKLDEPADFTDEKQFSAYTSFLSDCLKEEFAKLGKKSKKKLLADRYEKYRKIGRYKEIG